MRRIDPSRAVLVFWADLVFHEAALLADDDAKHLAPQVTQALDDFNVVFKLDLDTRRSVLKANAKSSIADVHIDEGIRKLHSATLFLVDQVRKRPEFKSLFSETINKVVRFALKRQVAIAEDLIDKLSSKIFSDDFRKPHIDSLKSLIDAGNTALADVRAAELGRADARIDIRAWKDDVNAIRLANYGELVAIAAKSGRTKDWADAFFLQYKSSSTDGDDELDESPVETGAPTG